MLCFRRVAAVARVRCLGSARAAGACGPEGTSWRHRHTPAAADPLSLSNLSSPLLNGLKGTHGRYDCWTSVLTPHGAGPRVRQGSAATLRALLAPLAPQTRGLCSGKPGEASPDGSTAPERKEDSSVPGHGLFKFKELHENPWTIPNFLCVCRIVLAPFLGHLIIQQHFHLSLALFMLAGATDLLDGYIARTWPTQKSALGSALDPLADKILISILYLSLTYAELIPAPLTALVIFRDIGLIAAVFWVRYKTVPPPVTLSKFFNPCYTTAQLKPTLFSKVNTAIQLLLVAASLASPVFHFTDSVLLQCLCYITAATTAASGYSYWHYGRKTVRVLNARSP